MTDVPFQDDTRNVAIIRALVADPRTLHVITHERSFEDDLPERARVHIEATWADERLEAQRTGRVLFNGRVVRVTNLASVSHSLELAPVTYASYVASRTRAWRDLFPDLPRADPLGVSVVIETADAQVVVGRRANTDNNSGYWSVPAGFVDADRDDWSSGADLLSAMEREVDEEIGSINGEHWTLTGISYDCRSPHPELHFACRTQLSLIEICEEAPDGEFSGIAGIGATAAQVTTALFDRTGKPLAGSGLSAMLLFGRMRFGAQWYYSNQGAIVGRR